MNGIGKRDYGSWIPASTIRILDIITISLMALTLASNNWFPREVTVVIGVIMILVLMFSLYMQSARNRMSAYDKGVMLEMCDFTVSRLMFGRGTSESDAEESGDEESASGSGDETAGDDGAAGDAETAEAEENAGNAGNEEAEEAYGEDSGGEAAGDDDTDGDAALRIIDVGCFTGCLSVRAALKFEDAVVRGVDDWHSEASSGQCTNNAIAEGLSDRIAFEEQDISSLSYPDGSFDAAVTCYGFNRSKNKNKKALLEESLRVVRKGGAFAFTDFFSNQREYGDIVKYLEELKQRLEITEMHYAPNIERMDFVPALLRAPWLLMDTGIIFGIR
ncbi:MAG: class I SAM-dependent methyltransferase [Anaerovoracaceae bacterium]|jgi:SAM-dependent methyltransferase